MMHPPEPVSGPAVARFARTGLSEDSSSRYVVPVDYCIWSSIVENAALSRSAFLISSALT